MVDAIARGRCKYKFACQDSKLGQDRYCLSDKSEDCGSQCLLHSCRMRLDPSWITYPVELWKAGWNREFL